MVFQRVRASIPRSTSAASWIAGLPVLIWVHDSFFSLCRVRGSSMEPSLKDGDILLVRKSDNMLWKYWNNKTSENPSEPVERTFQRDRLEEFEALHCSTTPSIIQKPPMPLTRDVVVYKDPRDYNPQQKMNIKRVVGLGGQIVMVPSSRFQKNESSFRIGNDISSMRIATTCVAPYSLWVEGDNRANSYDSRNPQHGVITKNLLVGVAEYVLWPPTRIGKVQDIPPPEPRPQSYWA